MHLEEEEYALVQTLGLQRESYLPLRVFDDSAIRQAEMDPLAGLIGVVSSNSSLSTSSGSDRMGIRLLLRPAPEDWSAPWQNRMQARRDGEDRESRSSPSARPDSGPGAGVILALAGLNWLFYNSGNIPGMVLFNGVLVAGGLAGFGLWRRFFSGTRRRPYLDETLVEEKLKSLGFQTELQIVRTYRRGDDYGLALDSIEQVINCIRSFDDPAGNSWQPGRLFRYVGESVARRDYVGNAASSGDSSSGGDSSGGVPSGGVPSGGVPSGGDSSLGRIFKWLATKDFDVHPFVGGSRIMGWLDSKRARRTVLSAREAASVWHLPLGMNEMASMERIASGSLVPFLGALSSSGEDAGPVVGKSGNRSIRLPESSIQKHGIILGRSGVGKSTLIKHIVGYKLDRKAKGKDDGAIVVIDPHADLVRDILTMVPPEIVHKVRLLDFGRTDRVPGINLVDPELFPDRDRCVDTIVNTVRHLWEHWGGRLEDLLKNSLLMVYEFNSHPETKREDMLTMLDILSLLEDGTPAGKGKKNSGVEMSAFQRTVIQRVRDPRLKQWFNMYLGWPQETRAEAVGPVHSRVGAYAASQRASVVMGQRESTIMLNDVLQEGLVLLVSTAQGTIGRGPAALMGGTMVSLVESALRAQESIDPSKRAKCLLVCDEFQTVTGADWEGMLAEDRKYGCSILLATQSLVRLQTEDRNLKAGVLGNVGVIVGYQMSAEDARIISAEMDAERVPEKFLVNLNPHHCCVRINSNTTCYPAFSMKTLPPPDMIRSREEADEAVAAVLEASRSYTVDYAEVRARLDQEVQRRLEGGDKLSTLLVPVGSDLDADPDATMYDNAVSSGASGPPVQQVAGPSFDGQEFQDGPEVDSVPDGDGATLAPVGAASEPVPVGTSPEPVEVSSEPVPVGAFLESVEVSPVPAPFEASPASEPVGAAPASVGAARAVESLISKGLSEEVIDQSQLSPEALSYIDQVGPRDPAVRDLIDRNNAHHIGKAYRNANRDAEARIKREVAEQVGEKLEDIHQVALAEALLIARSELALTLSEPEEGPRDLSRLRGSGSED